MGANLETLKNIAGVGGGGSVYYEYFKNEKNLNIVKELQKELQSKV